MHKKTPQALGIEPAAAKGIPGLESLFLQFYLVCTLEYALVQIPLSAGLKEIGTRVL